MKIGRKWVVLQLTEKCNLRCKMCYEWGETGSYHFKNETVSLDLATIKNLFKDLELGENCLVGLFGGEPFLHKELREIIDLIKQYQCKIYIDTNGTMLEKQADMIRDSKIDQVIVSFNGPRELNDAERGKGTFEKAMRGINKIGELRKLHNINYPEIGVNLTVTPENHKNIMEFLTSFDLDILDIISIELQNFATQEEHDAYTATLKNTFDIATAPIASGLIRDLTSFTGLDYSAIELQISEANKLCEKHNVKLLTAPKTMTAENIRNYFEGKWDQLADKLKWCMLPWVYLEITARGEVSPCHTFYDLTLGNIHDSNINEILNGSLMKDVHKHLRKNMFPICTACTRYHMYKNLTI